MPLVPGPLRASRHPVKLLPRRRGRAVPPDRGGEAPKDALAPYRSKRNFARTPEPADGGTPGGAQLQFVVQKHWASRLHYDFRLELGGTMKSWAVPNGPSYDPTDKRMAVQVEDHPLAYNDFEGQIPPGQYGAGRVIIWDRGHWEPEGDPHEGYRSGKLKFRLLGHKLQGHWTLVRMHGRADERQPPWLLIKERDGHARPVSTFSVVDEMPDSVSALPLPQTAARTSPAAARASVSVGERVRAAPRKKAARLAALPRQLSPSLATLASAPPPEPDTWVWELKFDGYRMLARVDDGGSVQLFTRNGHDWTDKMPELARSIGRLPVTSAWVDGEVIALDAHGIPDFQALQNAFDTEATARLVFYAFDLPFADGEDLRGLPVVERRARLQALFAGDPAPQSVRFSEAFEAAPDDLVASACQLGFEGVIGKRKTSAYASRRTADWIKLKCSHRQEFVIGGYTDPQGARAGFGSLLLGVHDAGGALRYAGNVGTGFSDRLLADLHARLARLKVAKSPFKNPEAIDKKAHWVKPELVAEVAFADWTNEGRIRHAVFKGLRSDKPPQDIRQETPVPAEPKGLRATDQNPMTTAAAATKTTQAAPARKQSASANSTVGTLRVSHADRVIDPSTGTTKLDLVRYYATVAPLLLPHLKGRPVSLVRAPEGVEGELFFQKHWEAGRVDGVQQLPQALNPEHPPLLEVTQAEGLLSAAQLNTAEFHTWNARKDRIDRPDRITFDLDPGEGVPWAHVQEAATLVHLMLTELGLPAFLKTSGGKGLHVVVPIKRLHGWDTVKGFSQAVVQHLARTIPQRFVAKSGPRNRVGKIFVDYLRNGFGATTASAWTARARPGMGVSVPVAWSELDKITHGAHWTVQTVGRRLRTGNGPWHGYDQAAVTLSPAIKALGGLREAG
ncbi:DNA ligase D [Paracidovorax sp. MALMAid1276]|uniref:DNA ligase D n=1 Tax=Paracidovorax sp. MALMAid1276 TaxID=3411631 RepID=UPI003B9A5996